MPSRRRSSRAPGWTEDAARGSATAELAVALPVLVLVLAVAVTAVAAVMAQLRCLDAAREGAWAAARGEPAARVRAAVQRTAPTGAELTIGGDGDTVTVRVRARVGALGAVLPMFAVQGAAVAEREPDALP